MASKEDGTGWWWLDYGATASSSEVEIGSDVTNLAGASLGWCGGWMWLLQGGVPHCTSTANSQFGANLPYDTFVTVLAKHKGLGWPSAMFAH